MLRPNIKQKTTHKSQKKYNNGTTISIHEIMVVNTLFCRVPGSARITKKIAHTLQSNASSKIGTTRRGPFSVNTPRASVCVRAYVSHTCVETDHPNNHPTIQTITDE